MSAKPADLVRTAKHSYVYGGVPTPFQQKMSEVIGFGMLDFYIPDPYSPLPIEHTCMGELGRIAVDLLKVCGHLLG